MALRTEKMSETKESKESSDSYVSYDSVFAGMRDKIAETKKKYAFGIDRFNAEKNSKFNVKINKEKKSENTGLYGLYVT